MTSAEAHPKAIGFFALVAIGIGSMVGAGIFALLGLGGRRLGQPRSSHLSSQD